jgi:hypothetical protein
MVRGHGREFRAEHENGLLVLVLAAVDLKGEILSSRYFVKSQSKPCWSQNFIT